MLQGGTLTQTAELLIRMEDTRLEIENGELRMENDGRFSSAQLRKIMDLITPLTLRTFFYPHCKRRPSAAFY
jgi:hypothetical protein